MSCCEVKFNILFLTQERDLERLRRQWLAALTKRQEYLDQHLQSLVSKAGRPRPHARLDCYMCVFDVLIIVSVCRKNRGRHREGGSAAGMAFDPNRRAECRHGPLCRQWYSWSTCGMVMIFTILFHRSPAIFFEVG